MIKTNKSIRKQCNLSPRNCDDSDSIQDVDFDKIESQVIEDQSMYHHSDSFPPDNTVY